MRKAKVDCLKVVEARPRRVGLARGSREACCGIEATLSLVKFGGLSYLVEHTPGFAHCEHIART